MERSVRRGNKMEIDIVGKLNINKMSGKMIDIEKFATAFGLKYLGLKKGKENWLLLYRRK